jgi:enoyl-CoA hydratase/carnithine racemase
MEYPFEYISVAVDDGLATVRFSVPVTDSEQFVASSHPMHAELRDVWPRLGFDPEVRAAVVTGTGDTFYVGPGLAEVAALIRRQPYSARQLMQESREIVTNLINFAKPLVAAVNGPAVGMGVQMSFLADSLVAYRDGSFHDTHVRVGLGAGDGGTMMWPLLIGLARSRRLLLRGHPLSAAEAQELGLVTELVERPDQVEAAGVELARRIMRVPLHAYMSTKYALNQWFRLGELVSSDFGAGLEMATFLEPEFLDTVDGILERQRPAE